MFKYLREFFMTYRPFKLISSEFNIYQKYLPKFWLFAYFSYTSINFNFMKYFLKYEQSYFHESFIMKHL